MKRLGVEKKLTRLFMLLADFFVRAINKKFIFWKAFCLIFFAISCVILVCSSFFVLGLRVVASLFEFVRFVVFFLWKP